VSSPSTQGTLVVVELPILQVDTPGESAASAIYAARSNTRS
jgi:hypothetical protein